MNEHQIQTQSSTFNLESMNDEQITKIIKDGYKIMDKRKLKRKKEIQTQIRLMAKEAGFPVFFNEKIMKKNINDN